MSVEVSVERVSPQLPLDEGEVRAFAEACDKLADDVGRLDGSAWTGGEEVVDLGRDERVCKVAGECNALERDVAETLALAQRVSTAVSSLEHGKLLLDSVPSSLAMRTVSEQAQRVETHMYE